MQRFCDGDSQAFDALFARHSGPLHGYLSRLLRDPAAADDLTQVSFLSLVRARGRFLAGARIKPWLYAIATNAARDSIRRRRPEDLTATGALPEAHLGEELKAADPGFQRQVHQALAQLPESQREAIILHRFQEFSFSEIAELAGVTESAVKVRAHRGYERLRELLRGLWDER